MSFAHLHCHSSYSLFEGTATPQALVGMAKRLKMPVLALTDRNNLYGAIPFYLHALKAGIKPVIGMEVDLDDGSSLVLLARNIDGYKNLCHLATALRLNTDPEAFTPAGFDEEDEEILPWEEGLWGVPVFGFTHKSPRLPRASGEVRLPAKLLLSGRHARGLVALSGGRHGLVNSLVRRGKVAQAARAAGTLVSAFGEGNFFIELTALDEGDARTVEPLADIANNLGIPVVATNDVLYLSAGDAQTALALASRRGAQAYHKPLQAIDGRLRGIEELEEEVGRERYFKAAEEMAELFKRYPQAIANTSFIAEQCSLDLPIKKAQFPEVGLRSGETAFSRLWKLCFAGATRRYKPLTEAAISRLKYELEVIESLGFSAYFLIVHSITHFAHSRDIPIMARGSAANSLVAYVLGITQVDPLRHDLLFERFLNPARAEFELPDIDLDLCWRRRDEVLRYVYEHYGRDHVAILGTHITFRLRSAWREMAKALGIPPDRIGYIASRITHISSEEDLWDGTGEEEEQMGSETVERDYWRHVTEGRAGAPPLPNLDQVERAAFDLSKAIEGLPRHTGMHCAGVVITPGPITDIVPLQSAARDPTMAITQYDKDAVDSLGLVKIDLLGSRALTSLVDAVRSSGLAQGKGDLQKSLETIPFDDERTYRMMAEGDTLGCFQLESPGMRGLLKWLRPRSLNDVAIAISLFRPGPLEGGFLETFMRRHLEQEPVGYDHPSMEPILKETHGVILYQEQFLRLAHVVAGLGLGEAEKLRKELGKKHSPEERAQMGNLFVAGAIERGIDQLQAERVWGIISGYTGFGFCKAHACSYALTAYRTAYMKAHYPAHYLAAVINNQGGYYGPGVYVEDARRHFVELLAPHVNHSGALCEVPGEGRDKSKRSIRFGLQFVKGLSERAITFILAERRSRGQFRSLLDLVSRVQMSRAEAILLVKVGACDDLGADTAMPSIGIVPGVMGEPVSAVCEQAHLNRKQMLWLLQSLQAARKRKIEKAENVSWLRASGAGDVGVQMVMGELMHTDSNLKILGTHTMRLDVPEMDDYSPGEKLQLEREALGYALSRNEMEICEEALDGKGIVLSKDLAKYAETEVTVAGIIVAGRRHMTRDGNPMLFITLQDSYGLVEVVLFADTYREHGRTIANNGYGPYFIKGHVQVNGKGRAIGLQPPPNMKPTDEFVIKMHPVLIAGEVAALAAEK